MIYAAFTVLKRFLNLKNFSLFFVMGFFMYILYKMFFPSLPQKFRCHSFIIDFMVPESTSGKKAL